MAPGRAPFFCQPRTLHAQIRFARETLARKKSRSLCLALSGPPPSPAPPVARHTFAKGRIRRGGPHACHAVASCEGGSLSPDCPHRDRPRRLPPRRDPEEDLAVTHRSPFRFSRLLHPRFSILYPRPSLHCGSQRKYKKLLRRRAGMNFTADRSQPPLFERARLMRPCKSPLRTNSTDSPCALNRLALIK